MARIKGFAIRGLLHYLKEHHPGSAQILIAQLPAEVARVFDKPVIASEWYPYAAFSGLLRQIDRQFGSGDLRLCQEIGDFAAREDIAGVFKMMLSVLSPDTLLRRSTIFWSRYSDTGKFVGLDLGDHRYAARLEDFPEMDEAHCSLMVGWMTRLGLISRARDVTMKHTVCVSHGGPYCQWEGTWGDA